MARSLSIPKTELQRALLLLRKEGIVDYVPQKENPQIIFLHERLPIEDLLIDQQLYHFRKNRYVERVNKAISYAETVRCRQQQLVGYFGEEDSEKCGICDVCLGRHKAEVNKDEFERYKTKIHRLLKREELSLGEIVDSFTSRHENKVLQVMEYLVDEGFVEKEGESFKWSKE